MQASNPPERGAPAAGTARASAAESRRMQERAEPTHSRGLRRTAIAALVLHVLLGTARIPTVVVGRRADDVEAFRQRGPVRFLLDTPHQHGADAVEWVLANVPRDAAVLYRGDSKGSIEFVPALLAPRLLVAEGLCPDGATEYAGRPIARQPASAGGRVLVIAALGNDLRLATR